MFNFLTILIPFLSLFSNAPTVKIINSGFIYESAPFPSCHASTLIETDQGILASWFGGTHEKHPDVSIYTALLNGKDWSTPAMIADGKESTEIQYPTWNPVLFQATPKQLVLFYKVGPSPQEWWGTYKTSDDQGKTWSPEVLLPEGMLGPIKNKAIHLSDGKILYPTSLETSDSWKVHMETSDADLKNWEKVAVDNQEFNAIQPTILSYPTNNLQILSRTKEGKISTSWSADAGKSWSPMEATNLVNNNSGIDGVTLESGYQLLVCNPIKKGRNKLSLLGSQDGITWEELVVLEDEKKGEFSYPAIIQAKNGNVHITYTYNREKIKHVELSL